MNREILTSLPTRAGVYLFKDGAGQVLYIGKASSLKSRVGSYFARAATDWKVKAIVAEAASVSHVVTENEQEAALLEVRLIREHQPKYNVMAKDGQPFVYLLFTRGQLPRVEVVRNKTRKGEYHGPLLCKQQARRVHRYLLQTFCLNVCNKKIEHGCLDYHLGSCPGICRADFDRDAYLFLWAWRSQYSKKIRSTLFRVSVKSWPTTVTHLNMRRLSNCETILRTLIISLLRCVRRCG